MIFEKETDYYYNFQFYQRKPVLFDLQVVTLACIMEARGIDSENILWSKLRMIILICSFILYVEFGLIVD